MNSKNKLPDNRFYVYHHIAKQHFRIDEIEYIPGDVVYVGSGQGDRFSCKSKRVDKHKEVWDYLDKIIVVPNLDQHSKLKIESEHIEYFFETGKLLNKHKSAFGFKEIKYEEMVKIFVIDESVPSGLRWIWHPIACRSHLVGKPAGSMSSLGYWRVGIDSKQLKTHRIVWCLANQQDCPQDLVIDHIDSDKNNNKPSNLRAVDSATNIRKAIRKPGKGSELVGVNWSKRSKAWIANFKLEGKRKIKRFFVNSLYPEIPFEEAKELAKQDAYAWRLAMEEQYYKLD